MPYILGTEPFDEVRNIFDDDLHALCHIPLAGFAILLDNRLQIAML
jgi:hypothetical protein